MKPKTWTKATRKNGHPIPKLWVRDSGTYYAQMAVLNPKTGTNVTKKICLDTKQAKVAEEKLAELLGQRAIGELRSRDDGPLLADFLPHFLEIRQQQRDPKTFKNERCFLKQFVEFIGDKRLGEITIRDILDYRTHILKGGIVNHTANLHVTAIRNLYKQAIVEELVEENPAIKVTMLDHVPKAKFLLTDNQITFLAKTAKAVLPMAGQQVADWILAMAYSGGRTSEVLSLKWTDVDFDGRKLNFRRETVKFKERARSVDFNPKLEAHLKEMHARRNQQQEWLFPSSRDKGDRVQEYGHDLAKVTEKAELTEVTSHFFRHYFISTCAKAGITMKLVIDWVGHKDFKMVNEVYTHLPPEFRQSEAGKLTFETKSTKPKVSKKGQEFFT
jgi:site-specific recombinase XerD